MKLTPKQERFVDEYLIDLCAADAARRAGYSAKTARAIGFELLKKPEIAAAISAARAARSERTQITADRVLEELGRIGFSDMRKFATWGPEGVTLIKSGTLDEDMARCVAEVSESVSKEGGSIKFKLHDKVSALEKIAKHLGMFVEKHEHSGPNGGPIETSIVGMEDMTPEQLAAEAAKIAKELAT